MGNVMNFEAETNYRKRILAKSGESGPTVHGERYGLRSEPVSANQFDPEPVTYPRAEPVTGRQPQECRTGA